MTHDPMAQWLATSTTRTETVTLFADQATVEALHDAYTELERAQKDPASKQRAVGEKSVLGEIEARIKNLEDKALASRSVWTLRALTRDETKACEDAFPDPDADLDVNPRQLTGQQLAQYRADAALAGEMRTLAKIARAVVSVEFADATVSEVSLDTLKQMLAAEYGDYRVMLLSQALAKATNAELGMPRPKSLSGSATTPTPN